MTDLHETIATLEERLLGTWTRRPGLRAAWTPDPADFFGTRAVAVAAACASVVDLSGDDLGTAVVVALSTAGKLKLWSAGSPVVSHDDLADPIGALDQWRELRSLVALRSGLASALEGILGGKGLSETRGAILGALRAGEANAAAKSYSDAELMMLGFAEVTGSRAKGGGSGFEDLDRITGGLRPGHVWVVGAPTNWGKTSLSLAIVDHHQLNNRKALIVTCEDAPEMLATRLLCRRADIPGEAARDARLTPEQICRAEDEIGRAAKRGVAPIMIDGRGRDCEHIAGDIRTAARAHRLSLVLVDYLQCISTERKTQDRRAEINHIARTLTDAIKMSGCAGILTSQITDEHVRDSLDVENAAEVTLIGRTNDDGSMALFVKKNKCGPKHGVLALDWNPLNGSFRTAEPFEFNDYDNYQGSAE